MDLIKSRKDPKKFWGIIKAKNTGCRSKYPIPPEQWLVHFKKLLNHETERNVTYTTENALHHFTIENNCDLLNAPIRDEEIDESIKSLKNDKSPGPLCRNL